MNKQFTEYTRSCAFSMQLSLNQVNALLWIAKVSHIPVGQRPEFGFTNGHTVACMQGLQRRGLCYWKHRDDFAMREGPYATKAGMLMAELLKEAGYGVATDAANESAAA